MEIKLSVIYVLYQNSRELSMSLASLRGKIKIDETEIVIVINDGTDFKAEYENTKIIQTGENVGYARACNLGAKGAKGKILWFLNPDTEIISNNNPEKLLNIFGEDKQAGILGPQLLTDDEKIQDWSAGVKPSLFDLIMNNLGLQRSRKIWMSENIQEADWVSGTSLFVRKDLFEKLGGFDEIFFMYFEDIDLCDRVRDLGYEVIYFPGFRIRHLGGKSFKDNKLQKKYYYASQDYYFKKHKGRIQSVLVKALRKLFVFS